MYYPSHLITESGESLSAARLNESTDNRDPDFLANGAREATERPGRIVNSVINCEGTLLKEAGVKDNREDACPTGLGRTEQAWQLKRGDKRRSKEVSTDEKNSEVGGS